jgi:hypothetical protein
MTASALPVASSSSAAELRRGDSVVRVAVAPGAPITSFVTNGHDWCAGGAWQDFAPTSGACALPAFVATTRRPTFPEGGLLVADEPTVDVEADGGAGTITAWWPPTPYPLGWTRVVTLEADGALLLRYAVTNAQRSPLPFVWGLPVVLPWGENISIDIPRGARSRVAAAFGEGLPPAGSEFTWPALRDGGKLTNLTQPTRSRPRRAVLCYVELPRGRIVLHDGDDALEISGNPGVVTHARVWINHDSDDRGAPPRRWWRRRSPRHAITVAPAVGAPALLSEAVGEWRAARWVEPGETIRWDVRFRSLPPGA